MLRWCAPRCAGTKLAAPHILGCGHQCPPVGSGVSYVITQREVDLIQRPGRCGIIAICGQRTARSRRIADVADHGLGRLKWADGAKTDRLWEDRRSGRKPALVPEARDRRGCRKFNRPRPAVAAKTFAGESKGRYFRMHMIGYFEGIDSERGIAWRCANSCRSAISCGCRTGRKFPTIRGCRARAHVCRTRRTRRCSAGC